MAQQVGVHHRGRGPLVFLHLGEHGVRRAHRELRAGGAHDLLGALLVRRVAVAVDEADGERLDPRRLELPRRLAHVGLVERLDDRAVSGDALAHLQPVAARDQRPRFCPGEVEHVGHADAPDLQNVAEAARGDQPGRRAGALQDGVGGDRGAVQNLADHARVDRQLGEQAAQPVDDGDAGVRRAGRDLALMQHAVRRHQHDIGERAADIDGDADRSCV